jgi:hypothetical protein
VREREREREEGEREREEGERERERENKILVRRIRKEVKNKNTFGTGIPSI